MHSSPLRSQLEAFVRAESVAAGSKSQATHRPGAAVGQRSAGQIEYLPWGGPDERGRIDCEIIASLGPVELEYAAIRRGVALLDSPHRGTLMVTGSADQRRDFLNRMLTQELKGLSPGMARQAFWLNRAGRIEADLSVIELGDRMIIDVDLHQAASAAKTLSDFIFSEDVEIKDVSAQHHHIGVHGKSAFELLGLERDLDPLRAADITIGNVKVVVVRHDQTGEPGYELIVPLDDAATVWDRIHESKDSSRVRPIGWHAFNIARIEAGTPLFNIDFGPTNLPHETSVLRERVSFTKGCFLGQEIVARMENLGKPKQMLVGLKIQQDALPIGGAQVFSRDAGGGMGPEIGVVTSSALSPMLGAQPVAFAMLRSAHAEPGNTVLVGAEGELAPASVGPLRFWPPPSE